MSSSGVDHQDFESLSNLAKEWVSRYTGSLIGYAQKQTMNAEAGDRSQTAAKILNSMKFATAQAWAKTESLLADQVRAHQINIDYIDPWQISQTSYHLYDHALAVFQEDRPAEAMATTLGRLCAQTRKMFTANDPRVIGFVSMQVHYSGQFVLDTLSPKEQAEVAPYFKVLDDYLYMPLYRAYEAAAQYNLEAKELQTAQQLLKHTTQVATQICQLIIDRNHDHRVYSGYLRESRILTSSIRDVEMFQVYLCVCILEGSLNAIQEELLPLCFMLYPPLQVNWSLVQQMLMALQESLEQVLDPVSAQMIAPYLKAIQEVFLSEILQSLPSELGQ